MTNLGRWKVFNLSKVISRQIVGWVVSHSSRTHDRVFRRENYVTGHQQRHLPQANNLVHRIRSIKTWGIFLICISSKDRQNSCSRYSCNDFRQIGTAGSIKSIWVKSQTTSCHRFKSKNDMCSRSSEMEKWSISRDLKRMSQVWNSIPTHTVSTWSNQCWKEVYTTLDNRWL